MDIIIIYNNEKFATINWLCVPQIHDNILIDQNDFTVMAVEHDTSKRIINIYVE